MISIIKGINAIRPHKINIAVLKSSKKASSLSDAIKKASDNANNVERIAQINKAIENTSRGVENTEDFLKIFNMLKK